MKIRSASSETRVGMMEAMGATVTQMNWSEVYSALQQGVCEEMCIRDRRSPFAGRMADLKRRKSNGS